MSTLPQSEPALPASEASAPELEQRLVAERDGIGQTLQALRQRLRRDLDLSYQMHRHVGWMMAGGLVVGLLAGHSGHRLLRGVRAERANWWRAR